MGGSLTKNKTVDKICQTTMKTVATSNPQKDISSEHAGIVLLMLAKYDPNSSFSLWRIPADIINHIVSIYTHFMNPMKHIKVHSVESEYDSVQWIKEHTLDFDPENIHKGWFSGSSTTSSWIVYDFGHPCFVRKFKITINSNGVKTGNFEISNSPTGPWKIWQHFTTPTQGSLPKDWVKIKLDDNVITRYVRINCLTSHGNPNGFYKIVFS